MQTASGQAVSQRPKGAGTGTAMKRRIRRGLRPLTFIVAGLIALLSIGVMVLALLGIWPPKSLSPQVTVSVTPTTPYALGLKVEKAGPPVKQGSQWIVRVKVTNNVMQSGQLVGTPTPNAATPTAGPAKVLNGGIKVLFYDRAASDPSKKIVGGGLGSVVNLDPGQSTIIEVYATNVGDGFNGSAANYEVFPDSVWTDKDPAAKAP